MKKILALVLLFFLFATPAKADYAKAYSDYTYNYGLYRQAYSDYQVAKSTYATYRTLASQNDAILKLRAILTARSQLMFVYYDLLTERLASLPEVSSEYKGVFFNIKESEKKWLIDNQTKINAASSLADLNGVAKEFENRYPQMDNETRFAIGTIFLARDATVGASANQLSKNVSAKLIEVSAIGEDVGWAQRGMINVQNKIDLYDQKYNEAIVILNPKDNGKVELLAGQRKLMEANQYLRDALNFMFEIVKGITG